MKGKDLKDVVKTYNDTPEENEKKLKEEEEYRNMERVDGEVVEDTDLTDRW